MNNFIRYLPVLKLGSTKYNYPSYGSYLHSDSKSLETCNDKIFIHIDCNSPFVGDVNIFVLDDIIKKVGEDVIIVQEEEKLKISKGRFSSVLEIEQFPFPDMKEPEVELTKLDENTINTIKQALGFISTSDTKLSYVFLGNGCIMASDKSKIFYKELDIKDLIGINKSIFPILHDGCKVGTEIYNTVVGFENGYGKFVVDPIRDFPYKKMREYINNSVEGIKPVCDIDILKDACNKIMPIFFNESKTFARIEGNSDGDILISASNRINGSVQEYIKGVSDFTFDISINISFFGGINNEYTVNIDPNCQDRLVLTNDNGIKIIFLGTD